MSEEELEMTEDEDNVELDSDNYSMFMGIRNLSAED
jgi:hypothetical protein